MSQHDIKRHRHNGFSNVDFICHKLERASEISAGADYEYCPYCGDEVELWD